MPITTYASVPDFIACLPQTAWGARTLADVQKALTDASGDFDDYFRGVVPLPLLSVSPSVSRHCAYHARYLFMGGRGFSPVTDADKDIIAADLEAMLWLDKVQRRVLFPFRPQDIDPSASLPVNLTPGGSAQPAVLSQPSRGWSPTVGYGGFPNRCGGTW